MMNTLTNLRSQLAAFASALALTVALIAGTVSTPNTVQVASANYVGELA